jgi:hypothetical protein
VKEEKEEDKDEVGGCSPNQKLLLVAAQAPRSADHSTALSRQPRYIEPNFSCYS